MTLPTPNMASAGTGRQKERDSSAPVAEGGPFVLNLCSSTTPMALAQVDVPELKRFTFFVSRRFEEGRERFRLHMGYFTTLAEAEEWLKVVREIYPGAWAGEAPGKKLRARAAAAAAEQAQHAQGPQPRSGSPDLASPSVAPTAPVALQSVAPPVLSPRPSIPTPPRAAQAPVPVVPVVRPVDLKPSGARAAAASPSPPAAFDAPGMSVPTVHAATPIAAPTGTPRTASPPVLTPRVAKAAAPVVQAQPVVPVARAASSQPAASVAKLSQAASVSAARVQSAVSHPPHSKPATGSPAVRMPDLPRGAKPPSSPRAESPQRSATARLPEKAPSPAAKQSRPKAAPKVNAFNDSNVREVLAALGDDTGETGQTRMMPAPRLPRVEMPDDSGLTDSQVLRYLENRRSDGGTARTSDEGSDTGIALLKPDDTGTRRALKEAVNQNAAVSFAVQLQWAVQPVELDKVPPLAIFSAYTLYTVEGSREGRKWYGLRLGFFSDAISAKQVAYYVRSEFASVAVVPVSPQERLRATEEDRRANAATTVGLPRKTRQAPVDEFKLIDSEEDTKPAMPVVRPAPAKPTPAPAPPAARQSAVAAPPPAAAAKRPASSSKGRVGARERKGPQTLEETLEILGAGELEIDGGRGQSLNETGVRHLRVEVQKNTPFSRLLERLSERTKKN